MKDCPKKEKSAEALLRVFAEDLTLCPSIVPTVHAKNIPKFSFRCIRLSRPIIY